MMQEVQRVKFCLFRTMIIYEEYHMCIKLFSLCRCVCTALCTSIARNNRFQLSGFQSRCFSQLSNMLKLGLLSVMVVREDIYLSVRPLSYYQHMLVEQRRFATHDIFHYSTFFGATVLGEVLNICPYSSLGMDIEY